MFQNKNINFLQEKNFIQKYFIEKNKVFLWGSVNEESSKKIIEELLYIDGNNHKGEKINFFLNTPGGSITYGMAIYDTIKMIKSEVLIIVTGMAASMGSILLCAAKKGNRFLFPNSRVLIHQPLISGEILAPAIDISIHANEMEKHRKELNKILSESCNQPLDKINKDTERDYYMNAKEALEYGIADKILYELP